MAKEICSFVEESGTVSSQLEPYIIPEQALSPASSQRGMQNAQRGEDTSVLLQSCLPLRCLASSTSGLWAPVWELPPGRGAACCGQPRMPTVTSPCGGGNRCSGSSVHAQVPRAEAERVAGSKEQPSVLPMSAPAGCTGPCTKEAGRAQGGLGQPGPDGFS